jgi:hypothetical protein
MAAVAPAPEDLAVEETYKVKLVPAGVERDEATEPITLPVRTLNK